MPSFLCFVDKRTNTVYNKDIKRRERYKNEDNM